MRAGRRAHRRRGARRLLASTVSASHAPGLTFSRASGFHWWRTVLLPDPRHQCLHARPRRAVDCVEPLRSARILRALVRPHVVAADPGDHRRAGGRHGPRTAGARPHVRVRVEPPEPSTTSRCSSSRCRISCGSSRRRRSAGSRCWAGTCSAPGTCWWTAGVPTGPASSPGLEADGERAVPHRVSRGHAERRWPSGRLQGRQLPGGARSRPAGRADFSRRQPSRDAEGTARGAIRDACAWWCTRPSRPRISKGSDPRALAERVAASWRLAAEADVRNLARCAADRLGRRRRTVPARQPRFSCSSGLAGRYPLITGVSDTMPESAPKDSTTARAGSAPDPRRKDLRVAGPFDGRWVGALTVPCPHPRPERGRVPDPGLPRAGAGPAVHARDRAAVRRLADAAG